MRVGERGVSELSSPAMEWGRDGDCDREEEEEVGRGGTGAEEDSSGAVKSSSEERDTGWGSGLSLILLRGLKFCACQEVKRLYQHLEKNADEQPTPHSWELLAKKAASYCSASCCPSLVT